jgi:hypothetical protein
MQQLADYYLDGICKQIAFGKFADYVMRQTGIEGGRFTETIPMQTLEEIF